MGVADVDAESVAPLDRRRDGHAAQRGLDDLVDVVDLKTVSGELLAVRNDVQIEPTDRAFEDHAAGPRNRVHDALERLADVLDLLKVGAVDLDSDGSAYARREHVDAVPNRLGEGVGPAWHLKACVHLPHQILARHHDEFRLEPVEERAHEDRSRADVPAADVLRAPLFVGLQSNDRLHHREWTRIRGCVGASDLAEYCHDLGETA